MLTYSTISVYQISYSTSSEMEQPAPPAAAPSPKVVATTKQPFASTASSDSAEADPEPEEDEGDGDTFHSEQALSKHVAREGVISGRVYRKSVVVSAKPKAPDAPPEKEGYLMKKSPAMLVGWQKRFFLTNSNGDIEYYKSVRSFSCHVLRSLFGLGCCRINLCTSGQ
jgi:hypothetical protein